jgi:hypothetical protein
MTKNDLEFSKDKGRITTNGRTGVIDYLQVILFFNTVGVGAFLVAGYLTLRLGVYTHLFTAAIVLAFSLPGGCLILLVIVVLKKPSLLKSEEHVEKMAKPMRSVAKKKARESSTDGK